MKSSSILYTVHNLLRASINPGDVVIDATAGNGHDTLFLAACVGPSGTVYAFDVQASAVAATLHATAACDTTIHVVHASHEVMRQHVKPEHVGHVKAVVFNLGYLPGGNKTISTTASTTIPGIEEALHLLCDNGLLVVVCYQHEDGRQEYEEVRDMLVTLPQQRASVLECTFRNQIGNPPVAFVVIKQPLRNTPS